MTGSGAEVPQPASPGQRRHRVVLVLAVLALVAVLPLLPSAWRGVTHWSVIGDGGADEHGAVRIESCSRGVLVFDWTCRGRFEVSDPMAEPYPPTDGVTIVNDTRFHARGSLVDTAKTIGSHDGYLWGAQQQARTAGLWAAVVLCLAAAALPSRRRPVRLPPALLGAGLLLLGAVHLHLPDGGDSLDGSPLGPGATAVTTDAGSLDAQPLSGGILRLTSGTLSEAELRVEVMSAPEVYVPGTNAPGDLGCSWQRHAALQYLDLNWRSTPTSAPLAATTLSLTTPTGVPLTADLAHGDCRAVSGLRLDPMAGGGKEQQALQLVAPAGEQLPWLRVVIDGVTGRLPLVKTCEDSSAQRSCSPYPLTYDAHSPYSVTLVH